MVTEDRLLSKQKRLDMGLIFRSNKKVIKKEGFAHLIPLVVITLVIIGGFSALSTWQENQKREAVGKVLSSSSGESGKSGSPDSDESSENKSGSSTWGSSDKFKVESETEDSRTKITTSDKKTKIDVKTDEGKFKTEIKDGREKTRIQTGGLKIEIRTENGQTVIKVKNEQGEEVELEDEDEDELLASAEAKLKEDDVEIATGSAQIGFVQRGRRVRTNFPLSVNPVTGELFVSTPAGEKVVTILPDVAIANMIRAGILTRVEEGTPSASPTPEGTPSAGEGTEGAEATEGASVDGAGIELTSEDGNVVYLISGVKSQNFIGLVPVDIKLKAVVSASDGSLLDIRQNFFARLLDLLSF